MVLPARVAFADGPQVLERVNPGGVSILPRQLESVTSYRADSMQFILSRRENWEDGWRRGNIVSRLASRARTLRPEVLKIVQSLMTIIPLNG